MGSTLSNTTDTLCWQHASNAITKIIQTVTHTKIKAITCIQQADTKRSASVAVVAPGFGISSETWLYRQVMGLTALKPSVICWRRDCGDSYPAEGISIKVAPRKLSAGRVRRQLRRVGNSVSGRGLFAGDLNEGRWLQKEIMKSRPDVIFAHYGPTALRLLPLVQALGIPLVAHFNGYDLSRMVQQHQWYRRQLITALDRFSGLIVVANYMRQWLLENGAEPSRVHLIPYGAPMYDLQEADMQASDPCRFIMVGRLTEKKRPDLTLRAFAACIQEGCNATMTIIGDGDLRTTCEQVIAEAGISDRVEWLGVQPNERVREELARSCVFVQHSVTATNGDKEGWPVAIAEAAGTGLAVVSTRHAGIVDQIDEGETGYLVDEGDWEAMAERMITLAKSPERRVRLGQSAQKKMMNCTTPQQIAKLEEVLLAVAGD